MGFPGYDAWLEGPYLDAGDEADVAERAVDAAFADPRELAYVIMRLERWHGDLYDALERAAFPEHFPDPDDGAIADEPTYEQWRTICQPPAGRRHGLPAWLTPDLRSRLEAVIADQAVEAWKADRAARRRGR